MKKKGLIREFSKNSPLFIMCIPGLVFFILFHYLPMFGIIIAFKQYRFCLLYTSENKRISISPPSSISSKPCMIQFSTSGWTVSLMIFDFSRLSSRS